jgi:magnesium chelatase family protein
MVARTFSATLVGVNAVEVEIESHHGGGNPKLVIVGLPDTSVKEARERVLAALQTCAFGQTEGTITINLAPADLKKEGPGFDLPIAVSLLAKEKKFAPEALESSAMIGELGLDGTLRPVRGILAVALEARNKGRARLLVPKPCAAEASIVSGIDIIGVRTLQEAVLYLLGRLEIQPEPCRAAAFFAQAQTLDIDFADVKGQHAARRALEVAVAGGHNLLMVGPPGTGKSMIAKRIITIMPAMSEQEAIETTKTHSAAGLLTEDQAFISTRPFRSPHHTISDAGLLGGGTNPGPGEVSLAHNGVLFLDELPEFRRSTLEVLRQPLEDNRVTISRAAGSLTFPSRFMLVAAMNPCPCGYLGDPKRACKCSSTQIQRYRQRISGPLMDRIDLHVEVPLIDIKSLRSDSNGETSAAIRERIQVARQLQAERYADSPISTNSAISPRLIKQHCKLDADSNAMLEQAMGSMSLSARAHDRILKVARTLADLAGSSEIQTDHLFEAISFRSLDRSNS